MLMRTAFVGIGVIAILVGVVWILQGANVLLGSVMSGSSFWLGAGIAVLLVGLLLVLVGARSPRTRKTT